MSIPENVERRTQAKGLLSVLELDAAMQDVGVVRILIELLQRRLPQTQTAASTTTENSRQTGRQLARWGENRLRFGPYAGQQFHETPLWYLRNIARQTEFHETLRQYIRWRETQQTEGEHDAAADPDGDPGDYSEFDGG